MADKQTNIIASTKKPLTKEDIKKGLKKLGITSNSLLEVHISLSSFGYIVNREYDICDALVETVTKGVVIMPAHTNNQGNPANWSKPPVPKDWIPIILNNRKPFNRDLFIPERVGRTPTVFLRYPNVKRTNHPLVSLAVLNNTDDSTWIDHSLDDHEDIHPLYKLAKSNGKILFMGTDFQTCTSIHLTEKYSPYAEYENFTTKRLNDFGDVETVELITSEFNDDIVDNFEMISDIYTRKYKGTEYYIQTQIGNAMCTLIDAEKLYDLAKGFHSKYRIDIV